MAFNDSFISTVALYSASFTASCSLNYSTSTELASALEQRSSTMAFYASFSSTAILYAPSFTASYSLSDSNS